MEPFPFLFFFIPIVLFMTLLLLRWSKDENNTLSINSLPPEAQTGRSCLPPLAMCGVSAFAFFRNMLYFRADDIPFLGTIEVSLRAADIISMIFKKPSETVTELLDLLELDLAELLSELPKNIKIYGILLGVILFLIVLSALTTFFIGKTWSFIFAFATLTTYWIFSLVFCNNIKTFIVEWSYGRLNVPVTTQTFLPVLLGGIILALSIFLESNLAEKLKQLLTSISKLPSSTATREQEKIAALSQYKKLMDDGVITEEEFQKKKEELLSNK